MDRVETMDLENLLEHYKTDSRIIQTSELLELSGKVTLIHSIGSQSAVSVAGLFLRVDFSGLIIMPDFESAFYFENDLRQLLPGYEILLFPSIYKKINRFKETDKGNILQRTRVLDALMHSNKHRLIVTYPEAIQEMTVAAETIDENALRLSVGEKVDVDFMLEVLLEYGFERTDFVYEPGEFSIRGGIIDIFSFGHYQPYRVELFGDEVESIRTFDPETQFSKQKISKLSIIPNFHNALKKEHFTNLFEFLPERTFVWMKSPEDIDKNWQTHYELAQMEYENLSETDSSHPFHSRKLKQLFSDSSDLNALLKNYAQVITNVYSAPEGYEEIDMQGSPPPSFNRNFDLLADCLNNQSQEGIQNILFSENIKQLERIRHIFEDKQVSVKWDGINISLSEGFIDKQLKLACFTDHQIFERFHRYRTIERFSRDKAITVRALKDLNQGDYVTHIDHGVGVFSGLQRLEIGGKVQETVRIRYAGTDILYVNIQSLHKISKYSGKEGRTPKVHKLGTNTWNNLKNKTKQKVKSIARELIQLYAQRKMKEGFAFSKDTYLQHELEASFIYEDTPDQEKATADVKADMEMPYPMDRLICGDVGFGKTEVALRAAFKAVVDGKQVAVLVPTTILAWQHYKTFSERLKDFPVKVDYVNRFKTGKQKTESLDALKKGATDIIIGTHILLGKKIQFKDLGLLVIDEEQKFGVSAKEKLKQLALGVDTLTLSATPIPRTLKFSLMGARDLSNILTPPPNRQPITTELIRFDRQKIREIIENEVFRGGQVFFVHNRVSDIQTLCANLKSLLPGIDIQFAHGQMDGTKLENIMMDFVEGKFDVLVSTNIIESGLDIENANTIIIHNAHHFGLSDLHQMRGRVGRSNKKAYCYLISPPKSVLTNEAKRRLQTLEEFSDLGSGFQIAMRDMDIRGAGNLLGSEQSGFIADIGYEMYHKILEEAIQELKYSDFKEVFQEQIEQQKEFVKDCTIETDIEMLIPLEYVSNTEERLKLYTELDHLDNEKQLAEFSQQLTDRFGQLPMPVEELFDALRLRWSAKKAGFERVILKSGKLRCYFLENPDSPFYQSSIFQVILSNLQQSGRMHLKQSGESLILTIDSVHTMGQAMKLIERLTENVSAEAN